MPFTVTMPKLSPTMEQGAIAKWCKGENEFVQAGELLIEVATDKATVEYSALDEGWLRKILVVEGQQAHVNEAIAIFTAEEGESIEGYQPEGEKPQEQSKAAAEDSASATIKQEQPAAVAAANQEGAAVAFKEPVFAPEPPAERCNFAFPVARQERVAASPLARQIAREKGLDLFSVKGSGPSGRVVSKDLDKAVPCSFPRRDAGPSQPAGGYTEEALTPMRRVIAERLQAAKSFIPHFYVSQTVDAGPLIAAREQLAAFDMKISVNDIVLRATALALRRHPGVNSGFHSGRRTLIRFKTIDISVAVNVEGGLITPIVRHADYKNLGEISAEVRSLAQKARQGVLQEHEYKGGSFTISNLGMFGITDFQAVINPPQAAILAVGAVSDAAVVRQGGVVAGKVMHLTLSCDHRVIDGALAAQFLATLKKYLENPAALIIYS